jgi:hypothetical protein
MFNNAVERVVKRAELGGGIKPRFVEIACGKAISVKEDPGKILELIEETNLQINVLETS